VVSDIRVIDRGTLTVVRVAASAGPAEIPLYPARPADAEQTAVMLRRLRGEPVGQVAAARLIAQSWTPRQAMERLGLRPESRYPLLAAVNLLIGTLEVSDGETLYRPALPPTFAVWQQAPSYATQITAVTDRAPVIRLDGGAVIARGTLRRNERTGDLALIG